MPLDFSEYPAIRTDRSRHLLLFEQVPHRPEGELFSYYFAPIAYPG
jgi:hypothetical protein